MPFRSEAQQRWMWARHPAMAKRWQAETGPQRLPGHVGETDQQVMREAVLEHLRRDVGRHETKGRR